MLSPSVCNCIFLLCAQKYSLFSFLLSSAGKFTWARIYEIDGTLLKRCSCHAALSLQKYLSTCDCLRWRLFKSILFCGENRFIAFARLLSQLGRAIVQTGRPWPFISMRDSIMCGPNKSIKIRLSADELKSIPHDCLHFADIQVDGRAQVECKIFTESARRSEKIDFACIWLPRLNQKHWKVISQANGVIKTASASDPSASMRIEFCVYKS